MERLLEIGFANAVAATLLAIVAAIATRVWRNPHFASILWLLVLIRLVAPPVFSLPIPVPQSALTWPKEAKLLADREWERLSRGLSLGSSTNFAPQEKVVTKRAVESARSRPTGEGSARIGQRPASQQRPEIGQGAEIEANSVEPKHSDAYSVAAKDNDWADFAAPNAAPKAPIVFNQALAAPSAEAVPPPTGLAAWHTISRLLMVAWIGGVLTIGIVISRRVLRFRRLLSSMESVAGPDWDEAVDTAHSLGLRRSPQLRLVDSPISPLVWSGSLRPVIVLPRQLWTTLPRSERRLLLIHELMHIRRGDHWVRRFDLVVRLIYFWHPAAWWASRQLQRSAEECCDAAIVRQFPEAARRYAETLLAVCEFLARHPSRIPLLSSGIGRQKHIKRRLTMIVTGKLPKRLSRIGTAAMLLTIVVSILFSFKLIAADKPAPQSVAPFSDEDAPTMLSTPAPPVERDFAPPPVNPPQPTKFVSQPQAIEFYVGPTRGFARRQLIPFDPPGGSHPIDPVEGSSHLSENVREQMIDKLLQGVKDPDSEVAQQSLQGLAQVADAKTATEALLAVLERADHSEKGKIEKLEFACYLLAHRIGVDRVVAFAVKLATDSADEIGRCRAIGVLVFAAAGNKNPQIARLLVGIAESPTHTALSDTAARTAPPKTAASKTEKPTETNANSPASGDARGKVEPNDPLLAPGHPVREELIQALMRRATPREFTPESREFTRDSPGIKFGDAAAAAFIDSQRIQFGKTLNQKQMSNAIDGYNTACQKAHWEDAEHIAKRLADLYPQSETARLMLHKAKVHVAPEAPLTAESFKSPWPRALDAVASAALAEIVPQADDVAVVLMEVLNDKNPRIRGAAAHALANAFSARQAGGPTPDPISNARAFRHGQRLGERIGELRSYELGRNAGHADKFERIEVKESSGSPSRGPND